MALSIIGRFHLEACELVSPLHLGRAVENAESARSVIYAIFSAHSAYLNVSRQNVPYFNVSRQNRVVFKTVLQQNNVEAC